MRSGGGKIVKIWGNFRSDYRFERKFHLQTHWM